MKITKLFFLIPLFFSVSLIGQDRIDINAYVNFSKYKDANMKLGLPSEDEFRVVFMGNSITEAWSDRSPDFFLKNENYINRGISGQVTHQMLLRFRADVIDLKPKVVVILAGANDIAQNSGFVSIQEIADNIFSMAELADYHGIKVIICSVLPAIKYRWRPDLTPAQKIIKLNKILQKYAADNNYIYVDYYSSLVDEMGGLKAPDFTSVDDLVHPNENGYKVMEGLVEKVIYRASKE